MKTLKRTVCLLLVTVMAAGIFAGCKKKEKFSHDQMTDLAEEIDLEEADGPIEFYRAVANTSDGCEAYVTVKNDDAKSLYETIINRDKHMSSYDISESTWLYVVDPDEGHYYIALLTFKKPEKAEKFYDEFIDEYAEDGKEAKKSGYTYVLQSEKGPKSSQDVAGAYLEDDQVLVIKGNVRDAERLNKVCKSLGIKSPVEG